MATAPIRLKTHWFREGAQRTPEEQASALGFTIWRVARQSLDRMRGAAFDVDAGPPYFAFLREWLVFLLAVADRLAHDRFDARTRAAFTTALVLNVARTLEENEHRLLGPPPPGEAPSGERFIDLFNELVGHYAEFGGEPVRAPAVGDPPPEFTPDFAFVRYLGHRLEPTLPEKDRRWVIDQVMASEAPDAVALVQRAMRELHSAEPRRARRERMSGE